MGTHYATLDGKERTFFSSKSYLHSPYILWQSGASAVIITVSNFIISGEVNPCIARHSFGRSIHGIFQEHCVDAQRQAGRRSRAFVQRCPRSLLSTTPLFLSVRLLLPPYVIRMPETFYSTVAAPHATSSVHTYTGTYHTLPGGADSPGWLSSPHLPLSGGHAHAPGGNSSRRFCRGNGSDGLN